LQKIEKDGGRFVCRDCLEGRNRQEEEEEKEKIFYVFLRSIKKEEIF